MSRRRETARGMIHPSEIIARVPFRKPKKSPDLGAMAMLYMMSHMGVTLFEATNDQGANQMLRHLIQFAHRSVLADRRRRRRLSPR